MLIKLKALLGLSILILLSSCGGGGSGGSSSNDGENTTAPVTLTLANVEAKYTGQTTKAFLDRESGLAFAQSFFGGDYNNTLAGRSAETSENTLGTLRLQSALSHIGQRSAVSQGYTVDNQRYQMRTVSESESCSEGGSATISGEIDDTSSTGFLTYVFNNCINDGVQLSGSLQMDVFEFDQDVSQAISYDLSFDNVSMVYLSESNNLVGIQSYRRDSENQPITTTNMVQTYSSGRQVFSKNLKSESNGSELSGSLYLSDHGYVDIITVDGLIITDSIFFAGGELNFLGAASSQLKMTSSYNQSALEPTLRIDLDDDGDGIYESTSLQDSQTFLTTPADFSDNLPPSITINVDGVFDHTYSEISLDSLRVGYTLELSGDISDAEGGEVTDFVWTVESAPLGSAAILDSTGYISALYTRIVPDVAGFYSFSLRATDADGQSDLEFLNIDVLPNEEPIAIITASLPSVAIGDSVLVDAFSSYDSEGDVLFYVWEVISIPLGAANPFANANAEDGLWYFTPDIAGDYVIKLTVTDSWGQRHSVSETIMVTS